MIETERLILAPWTEAERAPYAAMCADPEVMHDYGGPWDEARTQERFARHVAAFAADGFCKWSIRRKADRAWIGYCGLNPIFPDLPVSPGLEIGWRMVRDAWGHGYATEAARAAIGDTFQRADAAEIIAFTHPTNARSRAVMRRIGMHRAAERDFVYETGFPAVVYTAPRTDWV